MAQGYFQHRREHSENAMKGRWRKYSKWIKTQNDSEFYLVTLKPFGEYGYKKYEFMIWKYTVLENGEIIYHEFYYDSKKAIRYYNALKSKVSINNFINMKKR